MNRDEWYKNSRTGDRSSSYYKTCHKAYQQWRHQNGYTCKCVVHHRIDTEEARKYNEEHYERWGCNEDGTFEHGKYVVFMTRSEHSHYHASNKSADHRAKLSEAMVGNKNPAKRTEVRAKISKNNAHYWKGKTGEGTAYYGRTHSCESRAKTSETMKEFLKSVSFIYNVYKEHGGQLKWQAFRTALKTGDITFAVRPNSVFVGVV